MIEVIAYTDGAAKGNPGPGGYGVLLMSGRHRKELSQGYRLTTNNRMELLSAIVALESMKNDGTKVVLMSDSKYVVDAINQNWVFGWEKKGYKGKKNSDLWVRFLRVYRKHKVRMEWVKGYNGNPYNERCDELAVQAAEGRDLLIDEGYERGLGND